ncbi:MAG: hypothetical protein DRI71_11465 [Bacteroidetes bacterium]|nr:MAG: hypothetical protein DRI71_11465 [Bacteroidota bacterium]
MTQDLSIPTAHSEFSPSGSGRWLNCAGSVKLIRQMNLPNTSNKYAMEGSCAHELAAIGLIDPTVNIADYIGKKLYESVQVDPEMIVPIQEYIDYVLSLRTPTSKLSVENRVSLEHIHPGTFGTTDAVVVDDNVVHVIDLKYGKGVPVEAEENTQLMLYAVGTLVDMAKQGYDLNLVEEVVLHIVQPRCPHPAGPIRVWSTTVGVLQSLSNRARDAINNALSENPVFNPGEHQCKWCEGAPICRKLAQYTLKLAQKEFANIAEPFKESDFKDLNIMDPNEISNLMDHASMIENWVKKLKAHVQSELECGHGGFDYKLVRGRSIRKWYPDQTDDIHHRLNMLGIGDNELYVTKMKSPAQVEKILGKKPYQEVRDLVFKPEGKVTIAHISDKREALDPNAKASDDFKDFAN